ncbi:MAG: EAL domain-containing protein [Demequinaceae bacterium]|nr:EAL domain-containing protein [Demequinaceae bacterium]
MEIEGDLFGPTFHDSPIGMAVLDESGHMLDVNPAFAHLLGREPAELIGKAFSEHTHPDDLERDAEMLAQVSSGVRPQGRLRKRYLDGRGETVWARVTLSEATQGESPRRFVAQVEDITEYRRAKELLEKRALYDQLTGLPNGTLLIDRLAHALDGHLTKPTTVGVLFCDVDHFSVVNDSLGHQAGNALLVIIAQRILLAVRPGDTVARHGADEFIVILEDLSDIEAASAIAESISASVHSPVPLAGHEVLPTVSIGVALAEGKTSAEALVRDADTAMFLAKEGGRSRIEVFRPDLRKTALNRLAIESDLRAAVREGTLVVHYQPIVDLKTREVFAYEALVRWEHPARGLLLPDEFIEISEKANLVASLGAYVLHEVCDFIARHPEFDGRVFVNVSTRQIGSADLTRTVKSALGPHCIDPHRLCLEITETGMLLATEAARLDLENVAALGVELVLDDFGQGYSALSSVLQNPIAGLKLSKDYADRLGEPGGDRISSAIAMLTTGLGIFGIVEGIETESQHVKALTHGWDYGQGFLYGRPLPEDELTASGLTPPPEKEKA